MKNIIYVIFLVCTYFVQAQEDIATAEHLNEMGFLGNVKSLTRTYCGSKDTLIAKFNEKGYLYYQFYVDQFGRRETLYTYNDFDKIDKKEVYSYDVSDHVGIYEYDTVHRLNKYVNYVGEEEHAKYTYRYNSEGNIDCINVSELFLEGNSYSHFTSSIKFEYKGQTKIKRILNDTTVVRTEIKILSDSLDIFKIHATDGMDDETTYVYKNNNGLTTEIKKYLEPDREENLLMNFIEYVYKNNKLIQRTDHFQNYAMSSTTKTFYDEHENWVKEIRTTDDGKENISTRKITYDNFNNITHIESYSDGIYYGCTTYEFEYYTE